MLIHDYHELFSKLGSLLGTVAEDLELLKEAVHANEKGKSHVVADHLDRVIESLENARQKAWPSTTPRSRN